MKRKSGLWVKKDDEEIDAILPFMSLLLIIIPVLLSNLSFYQFRIIAVNTPGSPKPQTAPEPEQEKPKEKKEKMITAYLELFEKEAKISFLDEETAEPISSKIGPLTINGAEDLFKLLKENKIKFPKLENLMLKVNRNLRYDQIANFINVFKQPIPLSDKEVKKDKENKKDIKESLINIVLLREFAENQQNKLTQDKAGE